MKKIKNVLIILLILVVSVNLTLASEENLTTQEKAANCLNYSKQLVLDLEANNFSVVRASDLVTEMNYIYNAQSSLEEKEKGKGDFSSVVTHCEELQNLYAMAFDSFDSFISLQRFYKESLSNQPETSSVDSLMTEISLEIQNERYERVPILIDNAYAAISSLMAENTQLKLFYKSTTRGFISFVYKHRVSLIILIIVVILIFLLYRVTIKKIILNRQINNLNIRKDSLKNLIRKTQKSFFQDGEMSEADYNMRVKNFAEMVRDIDRQIPLLNEEYLKLSRKVK